MTNEIFSHNLLCISKSAQQLGIIHPVACVLKNAQITTETAALDDKIDALMQVITKNPHAILDRPEVRGFNELFNRLGYPKQVPAGQRLIETFGRKGFKRYNNIIDSYNIASATFGLGLGMHDAECLKHDAFVTVTRATGDEKIQPLFKNERVPVSTGDLIYFVCVGPCSDRTPALLAWMGKRDVDSDEYKITKDTSDLFLVALGNTHTCEQYNRDVCHFTTELIGLTTPKVKCEFLEVILDDV